MHVYKVWFSFSTAVFVTRNMADAVARGERFAAKTFLPGERTIQRVEHIGRVEK